MRPRSPSSLLAAVLVPALLVPALASCGGEEEPGGAKASRSASPSLTQPSGDVEVPDGVELTEAGDELDFGAEATVAFSPNPRRGTVLELVVENARAGDVRDLAAYQLDARTRASRPYYVDVTVKNLGDGDIGGSGVPLLAVGGENSLVQASSFSNTFRPCPSRPLPAKFGADATYRGCLVFLLPEDGRLTKVSFSPPDAEEQITWSGTVAPSPQQKAAAKRKAQQEKKAKQKAKQRADRKKKAGQG